MSFTTPDRSTLITRISGDLNTAYPDGDALVPGGLLYVLARVLAQSAWAQHQHTEWVADQILPDTADADQLDRHASLHGITRIAATAADDGTIIFAGLAGTAIPLGTQVQRIADGVTYTTTAADAIPALAPLEVAIAATADEAGEDGNATTGTLCELVAPIAGIDSDCEVDTAYTTGGDEEPDADLRERLLLRLREPPQGGAESDHEQWALASLEAVDRAWPVVFDPAAPAGTPPLGAVWVYCSVSSGATSPIPDAGQLAIIQAYLDDQRHVCSTVTALPVAVLSVALSIYVVPNADATIEAAIEAAVEAMWARLSGPGETVYNWEIRAAIASVPGITEVTLDDVDGDGTGLSDITCGNDEIASSDGVITFT